MYRLTPGTTAKVHRPRGLGLLSSVLYSVPNTCMLRRDIVQHGRVVGPLMCRFRCLAAAARCGHSDLAARHSNGRCGPCGVFKSMSMKASASSGRREQAARQAATGRKEKRHRGGRARQPRLAVSNPSQRVNRLTCDSCSALGFHLGIRKWPAHHAQGKPSQVGASHRSFPNSRFLKLARAGRSHEGQGTWKHRPHNRVESDVWTSPHTITSLSRRLQPRNAGFRTARHRNTTTLSAKERAGPGPTNNNVFPRSPGNRAEY